MDGTPTFVGSGRGQAERELKLQVLHSLSQAARGSLDYEYFPDLCEQVFQWVITKSDQPSD